MRKELLLRPSNLLTLSWEVLDSKASVKQALNFEVPVAWQLAWKTAPSFDNESK